MMALAVPFLLRVVSKSELVQSSVCSNVF